MPNVGIWEILLLVLVALVVFGPKKLPEIGRSVGKGMREFKDSVSGLVPDEDEPQAAPAQTTAAPAMQATTLEAVSAAPIEVSAGPVEEPAPTERLPDGP